MGNRYTPLKESKEIYLELLRKLKEVYPLLEGITGDFSLKLRGAAR